MTDQDSNGTNRVFGSNAIRKSYAKVFGTPDGMVVLKDIMKHCFIFTPTIRSDSGIEMARNEGARQAALRILNKAKITDNKFLEHYEAYQQNEPIV